MSSLFSFEIVARIIVAMTCVFCGTLLPMIRWGGLRLKNVFWDIIYGLGFFLAGFLPGGLRTTAAYLIGVLLWVPAVTVGVFIASGYVFQLRSSATRTVVIVLFFSTLCVDIDARITQKDPYYRLPFFSNFMQVIF